MLRLASVSASALGTAATAAIMALLSANGATTGMHPIPARLMDTMDPRGLTVASSLVQAPGSVVAMAIAALDTAPVIAEAMDEAMAAVVPASLVVAG